MRIGLIGWYGHGNAGDERILYCLRRLFDGDQLLVTGGFDDALRRLPELNACDFVVLGGGGLILRGCNRYADIFRSLNVPFGCLGLGVEARHADNQEVLNVLLERAQFLLVRDRESRARLRNHPKVLLGPDLTFLYPFDIADWSADDVCGLSLRPWPFWRAEHSGKWDRRMRRLARRVPILESVYPLRKWEVAQAVNAVRARFAEVVPLPLGSGSGAESDVQLLGQFFPVVDRGFRPEALARCRYVVGMRFHSLLFACQMGIPFVSLSYQPKSRAFCSDIGMVDASVDIYSPRQWDHAISTMVRDAPKMRERLLAVRAQNVQAIWRVVPPLVAQIRGAERWTPLARSA